VRHTRLKVSRAQIDSSLFEFASSMGQARSLSKVDESVPETEDINLRIVCHLGGEGVEEARRVEVSHVARVQHLCKSTAVSKSTSSQFKNNYFAET